MRRQLQVVRATTKSSWGHTEVHLDPLNGFESWRKTGFDGDITLICRDEAGAFQEITLNRNYNSFYVSANPGGNVEIPQNPPPNTVTGIR